MKKNLNTPAITLLKSNQKKFYETSEPVDLLESLYDLIGSEPIGFFDEDDF